MAEQKKDNLASLLVLISKRYNIKKTDSSAFTRFYFSSLERVQIEMNYLDKNQNNHNLKILQSQYDDFYRQHIFNGEGQVSYFGISSDESGLVDKYYTNNAIKTLYETAEHTNTPYTAEGIYDSFDHKNIIISEKIIIPNQTYPHFLWKYEAHNNGSVALNNAKFYVCNDFDLDQEIKLSYENYKGATDILEYFPENYNVLYSTNFTDKPNTNLAIYPNIEPIGVELTNTLQGTKNTLIEDGTNFSSNYNKYTSTRSAHCFQFGFGTILPNENKSVDFIIEADISSNRRLPDVEISDISFHKEGEKVITTFKTTNTGDGTLFNFDMLINNQKFKYDTPLDIGESKVHYFPITIEKGQEVKFVIDPENKLLENDETNQEFKSRFFSQNVQLDLELGDRKFYIKDDELSGYKDYLAVNFTVKNNGEVAIKNFDILLQIMEGNNVINKTIYNNEELLFPNENRIITINFLSKEFNITNNQDLFIKIDPNNEIKETNENNNKIKRRYYDERLIVNNMILDQQGLSSNTLEWNQAQGVQHYKFLKDFEIFAIHNGRTITDHYVATNSEHTYTTIPIDNDCKAGPSTNLFVRFNRGDTEGSTHPIPEDPCEGQYPDPASQNYVTGLKIKSKSQGLLELEWDASQFHSFQHFNIYKNDILIATTNETSFTDNFIEEDIKYTYKITTVDSSCVIESLPSRFTYYEINNGFTNVETILNPEIQDICKPTNKLTDISISEVNFNKIGESVNVSFSVNNQGENAVEDFNILLRAFERNKVVNELNFNINKFIKSGESIKSSTLFDIKENQELLLHLDSEQIIPESNERNNVIRKKFYAANVYLDVDVKPIILNDLFKDYVKNKLKQYNFVNSEEKADYVISIGKNPGSIHLLNFGWGLKQGVVRYQDKKESLPYNGLVNSIVNDKFRIYVLGNSIEGIVAALREFNYNELEANKDIYVAKENLKGLSTFDYFNVPENKVHYMKNTQEFADIVKLGLLGGYNFKQELIRTNDLVELRLKHIEPQHTVSFNQFIDVLSGGSLKYSKIPVVLAGGLWNNLSYWQEYGEELAASGRDVWLAEITGGPGTECEECPNYDFDDLTDKYWPAIIAGVQAYTGQTKVQYVGFSNGARTALSSLDKWNNVGIENAGFYWDGSDWTSVSLPSNPVDTLVAVGAPGAFEGDSLGKSLVSNYAQTAISNAEEAQLAHVSFNKLLGSIVGAQSLFSDTIETISLNLFKDYFNWMSSDQDTQPGNFNINKFAAIRGYLGESESSDGIVTKNDMDSIYENVQSDDKHYFRVLGAHSILSFVDKSVTKDIITRKLNGEEFKFTQRCFNLEKQNGEVPIC